MRTVYLLMLLVLAISALACWGKERAAYTLLQVGQHMFEGEREEVSVGQIGAGLRRGVSRHERRVTPLMKKKVAARYGWRCACGCGEQLSFDYHVDHILPLWKGGSNNEENLQPLNPPHHLSKTSLENQRA